MKRFMALLLVFVSLSILTANAKNFSSVPYNDSFFSSSSLVRNDALGYASASLADVVYQPGRIEEGLMAMGFEPPRLDNYQNLEQGLTDYAASAMSRKNIILNGKSYDLFAIVVRGTYDDIEWVSNLLHLGWGWDHAGFVQAESDLMENFREYYTGLEKGGKVDRDRDNNIIWITGHSRGAAVANLLAVQLRDYSYCPNEKIYAYTFACPRVTLQSIDQSKYQYIYNYNILADIFPHLPSSGILNSGYRLYGNIIELESFTDMHSKVVVEFEKISGSSYNVLDKAMNHQMALYLSWMKALYEEAMQTQVVAGSAVIAVLGDDTILNLDSLRMILNMNIGDAIEYLEAHTPGGTTQNMSEYGGSDSDLMGYYNPELDIELDNAKLWVWDNYRSTDLEDSNKYPVWQINCGKKVDLAGANAGMSYAEVRNVLGRPQAETNGYDPYTGDGCNYATYEFDGLAVTFLFNSDTLIPIRVEVNLNNRMF